MYLLTYTYSENGKDKYDDDIAEDIVDWLVDQRKKYSKGKAYIINAIPIEEVKAQKFEQFKIRENKL